MNLHFLERNTSLSKYIIFYKLPNYSGPPKTSLIFALDSDARIACSLRAPDDMVLLNSDQIVDEVILAQKLDNFSGEVDAPTIHLARPVVPGEGVVVVVPSLA